MIETFENTNHQERNRQLEILNRACEKIIEVQYIIDYELNCELKAETFDVDLSDVKNCMLETLNKILKYSFDK